MVVRVRAMVLVCAAAMLGCGGGDDSGALPPSDKLLRELSRAEQGQVCDWVADQRGGYGHVTQCDQGARLTSPPDRETCVSSSGVDPSCAATVAVVQDCALQQSCADLMPPPCKLLVACIPQEAASAGPR